MLLIQIRKSQLHKLKQTPFCQLQILTEDDVHQIVSLDSLVAVIKRMMYLETTAEEELFIYQCLNYLKPELSDFEIDKAIAKVEAFKKSALKVAVREEYPKFREMRHYIDKNTPKDVFWEYTYYEEHINAREDASLFTISGGYHVFYSRNKTSLDRFIAELKTLFSNN